MLDLHFTAVYIMHIMKRSGIANQIKSIRKQLGLTQLELSQRVEIHRYNLAKYETGASNPPGNILFKIQQLATVNAKLQ